jgi:hypothetical protein
VVSYEHAVEFWGSIAGENFHNRLRDLSRLIKDSVSRINDHVVLM